MLNAFTWIDATNRPFVQTVEGIAQTLGESTQVASSTSIPPPPAWPEIPLPMRMARLGFNGYLVNGVEVIVPPICDVPAGRFIMGSDKRMDPKAEDDEIPQYQITLAAFQICTYPLTVAEYACAVKAGAVKEPRSYDFPQGAKWAAPEVRGKTLSWQMQQQRPDHPVVMITWHEAKAYATWLAQVTQQPWRLPTEAEWEKAARGTDGRIYPWGNQWDKTKANTTDGGQKMTAPIGSYTEKGDASPWGAHDMAGNVNEWTSSVYQKHPPYRADQAEKDEDTTSDRVLRGCGWYSGNWFFGPEHARSAYRHYRQPPSSSSYTIGVRLGMSKVAGS
jgi:formylglycine-generating enzyme required for sulfatase activity